MESAVMEHSLFIKTNSTLETYTVHKKVSLGLESITVYYIYKYCDPKNCSLHLIFSREPLETGPEYLTISIDRQDIEVSHVSDLPWQVTSCTFPVVLFHDTVITGTCAVARHISKHRQIPNNPSEHDEGLLGFRKSCLQAPNETSVWTKFCEIDLVQTTKEILKGNHDKKLPVNVARFESHLRKPVKIHNVYKFARNENNIKDKAVVSKPERIKYTEENQNTGATNDKLIRHGKNRKWKSSSNESRDISSSTPVEELNIEHKFAEGPFLTLADLVLYSCYYIISKYYGENSFKEKLPFTSRWLANVGEVLGVSMLTKFSNILAINGIKPVETDQMCIPHISDVSLYKCDPKRHNPKKRLFTKEDDIEKALTTLLQGMELGVTDNINEYDDLNWDKVPSGANPKAGYLPDKRMERKCQQLENLALAALKISKKGDVIVDFCSGSGHLGILVAHLLPECTVILLENKEQSLMRARARVHEMGLKNVYFFQCNIDFYVGKFDMGLALHACGIASDLVLDKCLEAKAKFVICPCCYGSLHSTDRLQYPRSSRFSSVLLDDYLCIGHAADQTHINHPLAERGARCMAVIDSDRIRLAEESGYQVTLSRLKPLSCTPKNNLLVGIPVVLTNCVST